MAILYVAEFSQAMVDTSGAIQFAVVPPIAKQALTAPATSAAFNAATRFVRVHGDSGFTTGLQLEFGTNPSVVATSMRMSGTQTEYFRVNAGDKVAVAVVAA